jgi:16S rRNA (cytidine1402-2'-O)-methyltransferase
MATLYIVGTPIGNLEDITLRALKVLSDVDVILCEDTRTTAKLLARHGISKKTLSYHMHSGLSRVEDIIGLLKSGKNLALVSDAGTPGISDPGSELVKRVREAFDREVFDLNTGDLNASGAKGSRSSQEHSPVSLYESDKKVDTFEEIVKVESVPGPSALTAAISIAGVSCANFTFLGFLPHKKGRETLFNEIAASERTMIFYESPHRIMKTLESLEKHLKREEGVQQAIQQDRAKIVSEEACKEKGVNKRVTICRELTKIFEEVVSGTAEEVKNYFTSHSDKVRGEFVVMVSQ